MRGRSSFSVLMVLVAFIVTLFLSETVSSAPTKKPTPKPKPARGLITLKQLTKAFAGNCPPKTVGDAITCKDALPYINAAIKKYKLKTKGQQAAYIANMAYEGGYLKYNHNLVNPTQGTRSIMPAVSLRIFVDANKPVQKLFPGYPNINNDSIVGVLIKRKLDFEPGAWWTVAGPGCAKVAAGLRASEDSFVAWEKGCINGGLETIPDRARIYKAVYAAIAK
ncbi:hypothetical protein BX616_009584 [Lobosporangium transversale]|uniref:Lysozyme-like domain-containing protein n=1 Tax=Lobosporangium transversale TaxID=64571 RepID=A0A1Y2GCK4_9FUNG|nr:hypothetical protein BCR41DRAFT_426024 [Lobosporangium transversale]KAF9913783.1 hypothetical protein BX616_009584 [Lobosporangium transversale]ORZ04181.1 hypothetical protein BCR41DRAFT_426024 [Lobosporangium transversale]|eukprot:XP_021876395.1 hypothetical protein BCR41DRAFT_426024 [Lobosporangium transversale]